MSDRGMSDEELVLLPGWPQTWWVFRKIMPALAGRYRVVAVDIRGMGGSAKPDGSYDKKTMAQDVRELARHLGYEQIDIHHPVPAGPGPASAGGRMADPAAMSAAGLEDADPRRLRGQPSRPRAGRCHPARDLATVEKEQIP
jgi:alpha/beta hydrolase fold